MQKVIKKRLRRAKFVSTLVSNLPFVRAVLLNGSLAQGTANENSDIDLLLICRSGRIFTARFFAVGAVWLTGLKRSPDENKSHRGKICLNYFLADDYLVVPHNRSEQMNRYCAENYSASLFLAGDFEIFQKFIDKNITWMSKYIKSAKRSEPAQVARAGEGLKLVSCTFLERCLLGVVGDRLEAWCKKLQIAKIQKDKRTQTYPDLIVANDRELRFHPPKVKQS